jgi:hypothetical protein
MIYEDFDYDYEFPTPQDEGWIHEDELPDLEHAKNMLISVRNAIYDTGDIETLEDCLEELLACFELSIPKSEPRLEKKRSEYERNKLYFYSGYQKGLTENKKLYAGEPR